MGIIEFFFKYCIFEHVGKHQFKSAFVEKGTLEGREKFIWSFAV